jgi:lysophospholipase L1-like esterase
MVVGYVVAAALGLVYLFVLPAETDDNDPTPVTAASAPLMIALGDSFMSGEGADRFLPDTNIPKNRCHRATTAHPYLVAQQLGMRLVAATCSGATTDDFYAAQHQGSPLTTYGGLPQLDALRTPRIAPDGAVEPGDPTVVLVGIGGNDADFGEIVKSCLDTDCRPQLRARTAALDTEVQSKLAEVYTDIRRLVPRGVRVLVMTYPQPAIDTGCVPGLTPAETRELTSNFLPRLNELIRFQASRPEIGFEVVEAENAFIGVRLCESSDPAMNDIDVQAGGGASSPSGSIHPNEKGHRLLAGLVLAQLAQPVPDQLPTTAPPMPPPPGDVPPSDVPPGDFPPGGGPPGEVPPAGPPTAPPNPDTPPPGSTLPVPASAPCAPGGTMQLDNWSPRWSGSQSTTGTSTGCNRPSVNCSR